MGACSSVSFSAHIPTQLRAVAGKYGECAVTSGASYSTVVRASLASHEHCDMRYLVVSGHIVPIVGADRRAMLRADPTHSEVPLDGWRWSHGFAMTSGTDLPALPRACVVFYADGRSVLLRPCVGGAVDLSVLGSRDFWHDRYPDVAFASHSDGRLVRVDNRDANLWFHDVARFCDAQSSRDSLFGAMPVAFASLRSATAPLPLPLPAPVPSAPQPNRPLYQDADVKIAVDRADNCYVLHHLPPRIVVYGRNVARTALAAAADNDDRRERAWTLVADIVTTTVVVVATDTAALEADVGRPVPTFRGSISMAVDAFQRRIYIASGTAVYVVDFVRDIGDSDGGSAGDGNARRRRTSVRVVIDASPRVTGSKPKPPAPHFYCIRDCVLETRALDPDRDIAPALLGIRAGVGSRATGTTPPPGLAELIEAYARSPALPAQRLVLHDAHPTGDILRFVELPAEPRRFV